MELGITKIIDGIFLGDQFVATDFQFIFGNKVSHMIGWSKYPLDLNMEQQGVKHINLTRIQQQQYNYPSYHQILTAIKFIEQSKQEYLCCLVYSDSQSDAGLILCSYLMYKFQWNLVSSINFLRRKVLISQIVQILWNQLQQIQSCIANEIGQLFNIDWTYEFLCKYVPKDSDQVIVINTIKNSFKTNQKNQSISINQPKKIRRIQWVDRIKTSSIMKANNQRPNSSLKKNENFFYTKFNLNKKFEYPPKKIFNQKNSSKNLTLKQQRQNFYDQNQFYTIKQLSKINLDDFNNAKNKFIKRSSLKQSKSQKNLTQNRPQSNKKTSLNINTMSAKDFLNNLKSLTKINMGNYA